MRLLPIIALLLLGTASRAAAADGLCSARPAESSWQNRGDEESLAALQSLAALESLAALRSQGALESLSAVESRAALESLASLESLTAGERGSTLTAEGLFEASIPSPRLLCISADDPQCNLTEGAPPAGSPILHHGSEPAALASFQLPTLALPSVGHRGTLEQGPSGVRFRVRRPPKAVRA
ncbi:MAG: hypothetical protein KC416_04105 [Myxococcales bacterium]|nr:hypothetical protein [Myxococcales bacterium]